MESTHCCYQASLEGRALAQHNLFLGIRKYVWVSDDLHSSA